MNGRAPNITALVLAAGRSSRMGSNKLLADLAGKPLIRHCVDMLLASCVRDVIVVTGNEAQRIRDALPGDAVKTVDNPQFADGLSTSIRCGLAEVPHDAAAVLICLGDMPLVSVPTVEQLAANFSADEHRSICVPTHDGVRGNPVLWGRRHFAALASLASDEGGKQLMKSLGGEIFEVEVRSRGVLLDADTPDALQEIKAILKP